jgi:hypothetical protein
MAELTTDSMVPRSILMHEPADISSESPTSQDDTTDTTALSRDRPENPPAKRRKVPLACEACRDRKSRCDGARPMCSACMKRKTVTKCVYEASTLRTQR